MKPYISIEKNNGGRHYGALSESFLKIIIREEYLMIIPRKKLLNLFSNLPLLIVKKPNIPKEIDEKYDLRNILIYDPDNEYIITSKSLTIKNLTDFKYNWVKYNVVFANMDLIHNIQTWFRN